MKKVIIREIHTDTVFLSELDHNRPIFAKKAGKLVGMIVLEYKEQSPRRGWTLRIGKDLGAYGYYDTLEECIRKGINLDYEFFVEE